MAQTLETSASWSSGPINDTHGVAWGDVDGDGDLDLLCGNQESNTLYLNEGKTLATTPIWTSGPANNTRSVAWGDVDGDGDLDLVCGNWTNSNTLYLNEAGTLGTAPIWASGPANNTNSVAWGDVDDDGDLDLVCGNIDSNTLYLNEGGILATTPTWSSDSTNFTNSVAWGDVDGDGDLDLACGNGGFSGAGSRNTLYLNERGTLATTPIWSSVREWNTLSVAWGDVDGDGDLDLVCGNRYEANTLYVNEGGTLATTPTWSSQLASATGSVALGDVDGDGDLDLVCGNWNSNDKLYLNNEGALATISSWSSGPRDGTYSVAWGDVDGDGDLDLACGNRISGGQRNKLYRNNAGTLPTTPAWSSGPAITTNCVAWGDVDADGDLDLACGNSFQGNTLYRSHGDTLAVTPTWTSGQANQTFSVAWGDVDGDGDLDLACGNSLGSPSNNTLYLNEGGILATTPTWSSDPVNLTSSVAWGDVDGDGDLDLACGNGRMIGTGGGESNTLYLNEGGILDTTPSWSSGPERNTLSVAWGDVDGDGDLDLACGNYLYARNTLYLNEGGTLATAPAWESIFADGTTSVAWGDVDGDGDLDLICGNAIRNGFSTYGAPNRLYLNEEGVLATTPAWNSRPNNKTQSVTLKDVDGDGDLDLICGNALQSNTLYLNEAGTLAASPAWSSGPANNTRSVAWGDVDGDGDLDLACGNWGQNTLYRTTVRPPYKGDPTRPTHLLPNNSAFLRSVRVREAPNVNSVFFFAVDLESDPVWILPEYTHEGSSDWQPTDLIDGSTRIGPLPSSPAGISHEVAWDVSRFSYDPRDVILRLRAISNPTRTGTIQHVSSYFLNVGHPDVRRAEIVLRDSSVSFAPVTVFDTTNTTLELLNPGSEPLEVQNVDLPSPSMWTVPSVPFQVAPKTSLILTLSFSPTTETEVAGDLSIETNDPVTPVVALPVSAPIRPVSFTITALDEASQGTPFSVLVTMSDLFVQADSVLVRYHEGGRFETSQIHMLPQTSEETAPQQWVGSIPAESLSVLGLVYQVFLYKGPLPFAVPEKMIRVRIFDLTLPETLPKSTYTMFSLPLETDGTAVAILRDDLGVQERDWKLYFYSSANSSYMGVDEVLGLEQGRAYWLVSRDQATINLEPREGLSTPSDSAFSLVLEPGWNQVGNPFAFPVGWNDILTASGMTSADTLVEPPWRWIPNTGNKGEYRNDVDVLKPFTGYWVMNSANGPLSLLVPPVAWTDQAPQRLLPQSGEEEDGWRVQITATAPGVKDPWNVIGVSPTAFTGRDFWDRSEPPQSPGPSLSMYFPVAGRDRLSVDIRPSSETGLASERGPNGYRWAFDVAKNVSMAESADPVTLDFSGIETVPAEIEIVLHDLTLDHEVDLREDPRHTFFLGKRGYVTEDKARFVLLVGSEEYLDAQSVGLTPLSRTLLLQSYPNPFRSGTVIRYELAEPATAEIHILDVRGRLIRRFLSDHAQPGRYETAWYGDNEQGRSVPPGVYFYRLKAGRYTEARKIIRIQ